MCRSLLLLLLLPMDMLPLVVFPASSSAFQRRFATTTPNRNLQAQNILSQPTHPEPQPPQPQPRTSNCITPQVYMPQPHVEAWMKPGYWQVMTMYMTQTANRKLQTSDDNPQTTNLKSPQTSSHKPQTSSHKPQTSKSDGDNGRRSADALTVCRSELFWTGFHFVGHVIIIIIIIIIIITIFIFIIIIIIIIVTKNNIIIIVITTASSDTPLLASPFYHSPKTLTCCPTPPLWTTGQWFAYFGFGF